MKENNYETWDFFFFTCTQNAAMDLKVFAKADMARHVFFYLKVNLTSPAIKNFSDNSW